MMNEKMHRIIEDAICSAIDEGEIAECLNDLIKDRVNNFDIALALSEEVDDDEILEIALDILR